ncbi:MAG: TrbC/VirB2 family protein [Candidatus Binataceae bacterium]|nr:TrbC/VirB2 family protein [Candidatus Binataceae bacterium]
MTAGVTTALLLPTSACWAAPTAGGLPWDRTLIALQNFMIDSMAPPIIVLAFALAGILYALGGRDEQARRLAGSGIGGCIALAVVHLLNYVLP